MEKGFQLLKKDIKNSSIPIGLLLVYYMITQTAFQSTCFFSEMTGIPCPVCGLTRAGLLLLQGQFIAAWNMHPFIYVIIIMCLLYAVFRYILGKPVRPLNYISIILLIMLLVFYIYRMIVFFPGNPPMNYHSNHSFNFLYYLLKEL